MKLRKLEKKDAVAILEWMQDPSVNCYFRFQASQMNKNKVLEFIEAARNEKENLHKAIVDEDDCYLGTVSLKEISSVNRTAEYAIVLSKKAQGTGAGRFATIEILSVAFDKLQLNRVYLNVFSDNLHAISFYEKMGFIFEGEFSEHLVLHNEVKSLKWYRMLERDYRRKRYE